VTPLFDFVWQRRVSTNKDKIKLVCHARRVSSLATSTMPKRPATVETDSGSDSERGTPKRTRRQPADDSDSDQAGPSQRNGRQGRGRRARNEEDSDAEAEVVVPVAVDDEEFENAHRDRIRRQLESNNRAAKVELSFCCRRLV
jgi:hypothetical protein